MSSLHRCKSKREDRWRNGERIRAGVKRSQEGNIFPQLLFLNSGSRENTLYIVYYDTELVIG